MDHSSFKIVTNIIYIRLLLQTKSQYTEIWYDTMEESQNEWTASSSLHVSFAYSSSGCFNNLCTRTESMDGTNAYVLRSTDISGVSSLQIQFDVSMADMETGDTCKVYYAYDSTSEKTVIATVIDPQDDEQRHFYPNQIATLPSSISKTTVYIWLETDSLAISGRDYCYWNNVYLMGILDIIAPPQPTTTPPTNKLTPTKAPTSVPTDNPTLAPTPTPTESTTANVVVTDTPTPSPIESRSRDDGNLTEQRVEEDTATSTTHERETNKSDNTNKNDDNDNIWFILFVITVSICVVLILVGSITIWIKSNTKKDNDKEAESDGKAIPPLAGYNMNPLNSNINVNCSSLNPVENVNELNKAFTIEGEADIRVRRGTNNKPEGDGYDINVEKDHNVAAEANGARARTISRDSDDMYIKEDDDDSKDSEILDVRHIKSTNGNLSTNTEEQDTRGAADIYYDDHFDKVYEEERNNK